MLSSITRKDTECVPFGQYMNYIVYSQSDGDFMHFSFHSEERHGKRRFHRFLNLVNELDLKLVMINYGWRRGEEKRIEI